MRSKKQYVGTIFLAVLILLSGSLFFSSEVKAGEELEEEFASDDQDKNNIFRMDPEDTDLEITSSPLDIRYPRGFEPRQRIHDGETFKADIVVHNQGTQELEEVRLVVGDEIRVYGIGTLESDEAKTREIRIYPDNYEEGENDIELKAQHPEGNSSKTINFRVLSERAPVEVFLASTNSPVYEMETLEVSLVVAAAQRSEVEDLVVRARSENLTPEGYWVGEEMKEVSEIDNIGDIDESDLSPIIGDGSLFPEDGDTEDDSRVIVGRKLIFEMKNTRRNSDPLDFEMTYHLGNRSVKEEFEVNYEVKSSGSVSLIEADATRGEKGETLIVSLEISNEKYIDVEGVKVRPVETSDVDPEEVEIYPSPYYWIGPLNADGFLPLEIRVETEELEDGDTLKFEPVYRVGDGELTGNEVEVTVELTEPESDPNLLYYLGLVVIVGLAIFVFYRYRRKG